MKNTCELCRNFCAALHELRIHDSRHLVGRIGACCVEKAAQRIEVLLQRHPGRHHDALGIAEFRELTRPQRPRSANIFGRPRRQS